MRHLSRRQARRRERWPAPRQMAPMRPQCTRVATAGRPACPLGPLSLVVVNRAGASRARSCFGSLTAARSETTLAHSPGRSHTRPACPVIGNKLSLAGPRLFLFAETGRVNERHAASGVRRSAHDRFQSFSWTQSDRQQAQRQAPIPRHFSDPPPDRAFNWIHPSEQPGERTAHPSSARLPLLQRRLSN